MATRPLHAVITGGSRGIGLAIAQLFAKNAYRCTLISRDREDLRAAVATLKPLSVASMSPSTTPLKRSNPLMNPKNIARAADMRPLYPFAHSYIPGSVNNWDFWDTKITTSKTTFGAYLPRPSIQEPNHGSKVDVLVNCAGISQAKIFAGMDEVATNNIVHMNLTSLMIGTRFMIRQGYLRPPSDDAANKLGAEAGPSPVIINVSSLLGLQGGYGAVVYAASKAGVLGFTRALATEYVSHGVRCNALVPGYVKTDMTADLNAAEISKRIPLERFGKPAEIAQAALFLAQNEYAHNCVLNLDGGLSAV